MTRRPSLRAFCETGFDVETEGICARVRAKAPDSLNNKIIFFTPGMFAFESKRAAFAAVSLTGKNCELNCAHCRGKLLETMLPIHDAASLLQTAQLLAQNGAEGLLISGGSTAAGNVPIETFLHVFPQIHKLGLKIVLHTGFVNEVLAKKIAQLPVYKILIDVIADDNVAREVFNLRDGLTCVRNSMNYLASTGKHIVPHILIGLSGENGAEFEAIEMAANLHSPLVIFIFHMPHIALRNAQKISINYAAKLFAAARNLMPCTEFSLGCAVPPGSFRHDVEKLAMKCGFSRIAAPTEFARAYAEHIQLVPLERATCCCF